MFRARPSRSNAPVDLPPRATLPLRVLVVDDYRDTADGFGALIANAGHEVKVAYDGMHAIALAGSFMPQILLLDIGMPGLDGFETCRRIRAETWGKEMTIVAVSGFGEIEHRKRSREVIPLPPCRSHLAVETPPVS